MAAVGIDLGTTHTVVAYSQDGEVHVLADDEGNRLLPSVVNFHPGGDVLVGQEARNRRLVDPKNTIASVKRLIGRPWDSAEMRSARARFGFELRESAGQEALVVARGETYTLPEISAFVLRRARQIAEAALGETVDKAVLTVPAHFNELQRAATKVAGRIAGLEVLRIVNEPTAAALACGFGIDKSARVAIYDFGGGTFDCSILDLTGSLFEVLATSGDTFLGGDDIDTAIAEAMCTAFEARHHHDPRVDPKAFERLRAAAEELKRALSTNYQAEVDVSEITHGDQRALGFHFGMLLGDLEAIAAPFIDRTLQVTQDALNVASLSPSSLDHIILVGGSTRMPIVARRVAAFFGTSVLNQIDPDEIVAIGAAIQAAALVDLTRTRSIPAAPRPGTIGPPQLLEEDDDSSSTLSVSPGSRRSQPPRGRRATLPIPAPALRTLLPPVQAVPPPAAPLRPDASPATLNHPHMHPGEERSFVTATRGLPLPPPPQYKPRISRPTIPAGAAPPAPLGTNTSSLQRPHTPLTVPGNLRPGQPKRAESSPSLPPSPQPRPLLSRSRTTPQDEAPTSVRPPTQNPPPPKPAPSKPSNAPPNAAWAAMNPLDTDDISIISPSTRSVDEDEERTQSSHPSHSPPSGPLWAGARGADVGPLATDEISIIAAPAKNPAANRGPVESPRRGAVPAAPPSSPSGISATLPSPEQPRRVPPPAKSSPEMAPKAHEISARSPTPPPLARPAKPPTAAPPPLRPPTQPPSPAAFDLSFDAPPAPLEIQVEESSIAHYAPVQPSPPSPRGDHGTLGSRLGLEGPPPQGVVREGFPADDEDYPPPRPRTQSPVLIDVTPSTLGVETVGGYCDAVIRRNARIPCEHTRVFATGRDLQTTVHVRVAQGESDKFDDNQYLGEVEVTNLRPATRGEILVSVTFELDANGSLVVRATDASTGQKARATMKLITVTQTDQEIDELTERSLSLSVKARVS